MNRCRKKNFIIMKTKNCALEKIAPKSRGSTSGTKKETKKEPQKLFKLTDFKTDKSKDLQSYKTIDYVNDKLGEEEIIDKLTALGRPYDDNYLEKKIVLEQVKDIFSLWANPSEEEKHDLSFDMLLYMFKGNQKEKNKYLRTVYLHQYIAYFNQINVHLVSSMVDSLKPHVFEKGEYMIKQGEEGTYMCVLVYGEADVVINGEECAVIKGNTAFGEAALKHKSTRNASIIARTE